MIVVARITLAIDASGTEQSWYFCTGRGWTTGPADTPANTYFEPRLARSGWYRRSMWAGGAVFGPQQASFGTLTVLNGDGALDAWRGYGFDGRAIELWIGEEEGAAFPGGFTSLGQARMLRASMSLSTIEIVLRDRLEDLAKPACQSVFAGSGGLEGSAAMAGRIKPRAYGDTFLVPAILVDGTKNIWFVAENPCASTGQVARVGGVALTLGANYASTANLQSTAPAAGQARFYVGGPTYVRFETSPAYTVQVSPGQAKTMSGDTPTIANIAAEAGISGASGSAVTPEIYVDDPRTTYLEVLTREHQQRPSWFGFDRTQAFVSELVADPTGTSPALELSHWDLLSIERVPPPGADVPIWRVRTRGRRNYAGHSAMDPASVDYAWLDYYKAETSSNSAATKHPRAGVLTLDTGGNYIGGAAEHLALHGVDRDAWRVSLRLTAELYAGLVGLDLNDCVLLTHPRLGLSAGRKLLVTEIAIDFGREGVDLLLWG